MKVLINAFGKYYFLKKKVGALAYIYKIMIKK